ncbi:MAG TPA: AMP-binding protein [Steroidobacteraceae bacterium]|nr:AMP-binding protein [Steroidobacteraceae bacterium]
MLRSLLSWAAPRAKSEGLVDRAVRYNPWIRRRVADAMALAATCSDADALHAMAERLTAVSLRAALSTRYGQGRGNVLADWPLLDKATVVDAPERFRSRAVRFALPAGTGGTTGVPLRIWRSLECVVAEQAFLDGLLAPHRLTMRQSRVAILRGDRVKDMRDQAPPFGRISHGGKRLTLSAAHLNPDSFPWYAAALGDFAPSVLWVYPSAAQNLLRLYRESGRQQSVPVMLASSEMMPPGLHRALEEQFRCRVINYYGQAERVCLAVSTVPGEFRFIPEYGRVELLPRPAEPGAALQAAEIVATSYWNAAMPLVRYRTGDSLMLPQYHDAEWLSEIALGLRPFEAVLGREGEYLLTRDGMRIIGLNQIPREVRHVAQLQLVQTDFEQLEVHVAALPGYDADDERDILERARSKVPAAMHVSVRTVPQLAVNARGKAPFVIRHVGG